MVFIVFVQKGFSQDSSSDKGKTTSTEQSSDDSLYNFGKVEEREITIRDKYAIVDGSAITLTRLKKEYSKGYYNSLNRVEYFEKSNKVEDLGGKKVIYLKTDGDKVSVLVPPLKPNRFYQIKIPHSTRYNLYSLFKAMNEEGFDKKDKYKENQDWMEIIQVLNLDTDYKMVYIPSISELKDYKEKLKDFDLGDSLPNVLDILTKTQKTLIRKITLESFEILNFRKNASIEKIIDFAKWASDLNEVTSEECGDFLKYFLIPDYLRIYDFYFNNLKEKILDYNDVENVKSVLQNAIRAKKSFYGMYPEANPAPNFIGPPMAVLTGAFMDLSGKQIAYDSFNTFEFDFKTNFKRSLVPDFGYVWNLPTIENGLNGGQLFVGVNISLSPVNKNVPLTLSNLTPGQRLSIHTGITLNSLAKENFREDFFGSNSLLLGIGYKALTQSTRLNGGVLLFQQLDPINGSKSLGVHPYIGLSIDIEIKKWLESTIPNLKDKIN